MIRRLWEDIDLPLICGAGFTVALTGLFFSQFPDDIKRVKKLNRAATDLKTGNVQTADTLKKLALDTIDDALKDLQKKHDFKNVDVVLKGKVTSNKSVESKMKPGTQLLFQELRTYPITTNLERFKNPDNIQFKETDSPVYVEGKSGEGQPNRVLISLAHPGQFEGVMQELGRKNFPMKLNWVETVLSGFIDVLSSVTNFFGGKMSRIEAGYCENEYGVVLNSSIVMLCTVKVSLTNKTTAVHVVDKITTSESQLLHKIDEELIALYAKMGFSALMGTLVAVIGSMALAGYYSYRRARIIRGLGAAAAPVVPGNEINNNDIILAENFMCKTCAIKPRNIVHMPCKHAVFCDECWDKLDFKDNCGRCEQPIGQSHKLFIN